MTEEAYIIDAKRTPIGKFGGSLSSIPAPELAAHIISNLLTSHPTLKNNIDEVIFGNTLSAGLGQNPARIAAIQAGLSQKIPSFTINKVCGSGLKSVALAAQAIYTGDANCVLAGGMENMTRTPYILENYRFGAKAGNQTIKDSMIYDGLFCSLIGEHMGMTAENVAKKFKISRKTQEEFAVKSHRKALFAIKEKRFKKEIIGIKVKKGKSEYLFDTDEQPREDTTLENVSKLSPAFAKKGTVTAATASPLNDGAACAIITSQSFAKKHDLKPIAKIRAFASIGLDPKIMGMGSYYAAGKALSKTKLTNKEIDIWELNEAFASQSIAVIEMLGIDEKKVNPNGGAIALGHPIGASGTRILTTLLYELKRKSKQFGIASLCIGGGQGIAMIVENI